MERILSNQLVLAKGLIQKEPSNMNLSHSVAHTRDRLRRHQQDKVRGAMIRSRAQWLQLGDKGTKFFFSLLREKQCREKVDKLWIDGKEDSQSDEIKEEFCLLYHKLFSSEDSPSSYEARGKCRMIISEKIAIAIDDIIAPKRPFMVEEIKKPIMNLRDKKSTGPDGLPIEFYKANID